LMICQIPLSTNPLCIKLALREEVKCARKPVQFRPSQTNFKGHGMECEWTMKAHVHVTSHKRLVNTTIFEVRDLEKLL
jgi:hypothetical protein